MSFFQRLREKLIGKPQPREKAMFTLANPDGTLVYARVGDKGDKEYKIFIKSPTLLPIRFFTGVQEATIDGVQTFKIKQIKLTGVEYPSDFDSYQDYLDAYSFVPFVARSIDIKNHYVWQSGYDLEGDETEVERASKALQSINADTVIREGCRWALVFGNFYWRIEKGDPPKLTPLNPLGVGVKLDKDGSVVNYVYKPEWNKRKELLKPDEVLHLKLFSEPWEVFGYGVLRRVIVTVKQILYMERYLPEIARKRADPWLHFTIKDPLTNQPYSEDEFNRIKKAILNRKPGEDLIDDGSITVEEIYQAANVGGRQTLEGLLSHFRQNLVAGLGVPEIYLGFGGTTLKGTAEHQEKGFEAEIRAIQRALKRFHEQQLWPILGISPDVKLVWRPLKPEDKAALSKQLMEEIKHGVVTPEFARQRLGYPDDMEGTFLFDSRLTIWSWRSSDEKTED